ncbi:hypothetical protein GCM10010407_13900 [Rarobacter incanus]
MLALGRVGESVGVEVVGVDGFAGFKTAAAEELPTAVTVMNPFHAVRLAAEGLDECRRRVQQQTLFTGGTHVAVVATWHVYQDMIDAYRRPDPSHGMQLTTGLVERLSHSVPTGDSGPRNLQRVHGFAAARPGVSWCVRSACRAAPAKWGSS